MRCSALTWLKKQPKSHFGRQHNCQSCWWHFNRHWKWSKTSYFAGHCQKKEDSKNIRSYQNVLNMENVSMSSRGRHSKGFVSREKEIQCSAGSCPTRRVSVFDDVHTCCSLRTGCGAAKYRPVFDQQRFWLMTGVMMQSCFKWWVVCKGRHTC